MLQYIVVALIKYTEYLIVVLEKYVYTFCENRKV